MAFCFILFVVVVIKTCRDEMKNYCYYFCIKYIILYKVIIQSIQKLFEIKDKNT